ncbi:MAG: L,D-transpeptidase family protein [Lachnospiraceae bacterium]|nr:L,D-transpeptidase family protein [Lachnospiraceae bacterium]
MNKKKWLTVVIVLASVLLVTGGIYLGLAGYYSERFCYGTWINGVYCTGKTVDEVNAELVMLATYDKITIIDRNNSQYEVALEEIEYGMDYTGALKEIKGGQKEFEWIRYYFTEQNFDVMPVVTFSEEKLADILYKADFMKKEVLAVGNRPEIVLEEDGYHLYDHTVNQIVPERVCKAVSNALHNLEQEVYVAEQKGCYVTMPVTQENLDIYKLWNDIYAFQSFELTYILGDREEKIDSSVVSKWIAIDENTGAFIKDMQGNLVLDEAKVLEYAVSLGEKYDTVGKPREFMSTRGDLVTIEKSTYGNDIDEEEECALLIEDFTLGRSGTEREPVYASKAWSQGEDDIGGTYIEVDMTEQMLYYYVDYELALETPVVTGNMRRGWDTPAVVCSIYGKARNRILRCATYATFVYYWMPVYGNIGLHDATWRRKFGDDIYMTDGSHGCINMPKDKAAELYGMVEMDTPVVLFY